MKCHDEFIITYKELENVVRDEYSSVREYEESLDDETSKKLQLCRIMRNYIQHNVDYEKFVVITPAMQSFLTDQLRKVESKNAVLKDMMLSKAKYGCFFDKKTPIMDVAVTLRKKKQNVGVIVGQDGCVEGFISKAMISDALATVKLTAKTTIASVIETIPLENYSFAYMDCSFGMKHVMKLLEADANKIIIATTSGKKSDDKLNIVGVYNI